MTFISTVTAVQSLKTIAETINVLYSSLADNSFLCASHAFGEKCGTLQPKVGTDVASSGHPHETHTIVVCAQP
jgi:hypothetical protein